MPLRRKGSCFERVGELTPREFLDRREGGEDMTLLDVREDWEVEMAPVPTDTVHIPMGEIVRPDRRTRSQKGDGGDLPVRRRAAPRWRISCTARVSEKFLTCPAEFWPGPGL